jgi:amino acid adenylation domain-containing protein
MFREINENFLLTSSKFIEQREYWVNKLAGTIGKTGILRLKKENPLPAKNDKSMDFSINGDLYRRLIALGKKSDLSLYIILLTSLKILIHRYTNNKDITVISPLFRRNISAETISHDVFIRDWIGEGTTFKELLFKIRKNLLEVYANQDYPSGRLIDYLFNNGQIQKKESISDIVCSLENIHDNSRSEAFKDKLTFSFIKEDDRVNGSILYHSARYEKWFMEKISGHLVNVLKYALEDTNVKISGIPLLSEQEKKQLIVDFNRTQSVYPKNRTTCELFEKQVEKSPDTISITCGETQISFRQLNESVGCLAGHLRVRGVQPGAVVGLIMEPSIDMIAAAAAIIKAGGAYLPIPLQYPPKRIDYILKDSHAMLLLTQPHLSRKYDLEIETLTVEINRPWWETGTGTTPGSVPGPADPVYMIYTSGSTGKSKGVLLEHKNLVNYISWFVHTAQLTPRDRTLLTSSFAFDLGYTAVYSSLLAGCQLHISPESNYWLGEVLIDYIKRRAISYIKTTPSLFTLIVENPGFSGELFKTLRLIVLGGEEINVKDVEKAYQNRQGQPLNIMNHYGPTEATIGCVAQFIDFRHIEEYKECPTIGSPIDNTQAYILDSHLNLLPVGVPGELCVSGDGIARGYLNRPLLSKEKFISDPYRPARVMYRTGDLGRWLSNGRIQFLGRIDQQAKVRGYRVEPAEVESLLLKHKCVKEAVVTVKEHQDGNKYLCAYFISNNAGINTGNEHQAADLREHLKKNLPEYMVPSYFIQVERIPLTPNGKLDRKALPEPDPGASDAEYTAPRNDVEKKLVELWREILGIEKDRIGIDCNFFESGGHSLNATVLLSRIHKAFNVKMPLVEIFTNPTIRGLARELKKPVKSQCRYASIEPVEKQEYYSLSSAQRRGYFLYQMDGRNIVYNVPFVVAVEGDINKNRLESTFMEVIERHESLRTSFEIAADEPVQRIHDKVRFEIEYLTAEDTGSTGAQPAANTIKSFIRPFDLSRVPLLRVGLVKLPHTSAALHGRPTQEGKGDKYLLLVDMHHIISDGVSMKIFLQDFAALYDGEALPPLRLHYKDYSQWQNREKEKESYTRQAAYWQRKFQEETPVLELPTDFARTRRQSFEGGRVTFEISVEETRQLKTLALQHGTTLYMVLLAVFNVFLSKITNQETIVVGTAVAGRSHADLEQIIGMFINMLGLINYPAGQKQFDQFLKEVKEKTLEAFENRDYPFEEVVEKVSANRDTGGNPLFNVVFALQDSGISKMEIPGLKLEPYGYDDNTSKFDFTLLASEEKDNLLFSLEYSTKLFKKETIQRLIAYFKTAAGIAGKRPASRIADIEIISETEKNRLLFEFNDTKAEYPKNKTIHELFEEQVRENYDRIALKGPSGEPGPVPGSRGHTFVSYGELNKESNRLGNLLRSKGVRPGTIVGIILDPSLEMIAAILGVLKAGGTYLPIDPTYPPERVTFILEDARAPFLLTRNRLNEKSPIPFIFFCRDCKPGVRQWKMCKNRSILAVSVPRFQIWMPFPFSTVHRWTSIDIIVISAWQW